MADHYTQFSFTFPVDEAEQAWLQAKIDRITALIFGEVKPETEWEENLVEEWSFGLAVNFEEGAAYFMSEDSGNVELVIDVVQQFLSHFRPTAAIGFAWANTCSKPRPGEFGGGACVITATETKFINTSLWLDEQFASRANS